MTNPLKAQTAAHSETLAATDTCVMCGLCLPQCPTYLKTRHEADSPRGRIALIQGLAQGELSADTSLISHLDGCLVCRACEDMCPSRVPYARLIVTARAELATHQHHKATDSLRLELLRLFTHNSYFRRLTHNLLRTWSVIRRVVPARSMDSNHSAHPMRLLSLAPPLKKSPLINMKGHPGSGSGKTVQLFTGCAGEVFDRETLSDTRMILEFLGYQVHIPSEQTCCGALALHSGNLTDARKLAEKNSRAFNSDQTILSTATGCTATLKEAGSWFGEKCIGLANASEDICSFLQQADWSQISLNPTPLRVAVHAPCTLRHVLHTDTAVTALLTRIPGIDLVTLGNNNRCCGAAGQYMLDHPAMADTLADEIIADLRNLAPDVLVTSNIGCALHLQAAMRRASLPLEVLHPVQLLARQIKTLATIQPVT